MKNPLNIKICNKEFLVAELIDKNLEYPEVKRLIETVSSKDDSYIVHEPMLEDIVTPNDNWSCHDAEQLKIGFEFVSKQLCYISMGIETLEEYSKIQEGCDEQICWNLIDDDYYGRFIVYYSKRMCDLKIIPNRYSMFIEAIIGEASGT